MAFETKEFCGQGIGVPFLESRGNNVRVWAILRGTTHHIGFSDDYMNSWTKHYPLSYNTQTYHLLACGADELWLTNANERNIRGHRSGVHRFTKGRGIFKRWKETLINGSPIMSAPATSEDDFVFMGWGRHALIPPQSKYVFVTRGWLAQDVIRICRI